MVLEIFSSERQARLTGRAVSYALNGVWKNLNHKDAFLRNLPYLGIASVGIGSIIFHSTNRYFTQWGKSSNIFPFVKVHEVVWLHLQSLKFLLNARNGCNEW